MGDRNNPIKFGPEWLRNLSREPSAGGSGANNHNSPPGGSINNTSGSPGPGTMGPNTGNMTGPHTGIMPGSNFGTMAATGTVGPTAGSPVGATSSSVSGVIASGTPIAGPSTGVTSRTKSNNNMSKVLLAKLRYGREEMLALYDRSAESPEELKHFDILYQPRAKPPFALNNTFEEDSRDNVRGGPSLTLISTPERYSVGRGSIGRGGGVTETRGRPRMPFVRQTSLGRGNTSWHVNNTRMPNYNTGPEEDATLRPWNSSNGGIPANRTNSEPPEWNPSKMFRRRQNNNTNWRQSHAREENDEWRAQENPRNRPPVDKWDREWGDRPNQERQQSWNSNRRTWVGNETQNNDDNLPEWAVDNAEAGAGTFDSSGAFHGYSNDDSNLPKSQETSFPLARSHTHGSFARTKTTEEGSEEWWASEKAKKLSAKKFDTGEAKFIQTGTFGSAEGANSNSKASTGRDARDEDLLDEIDKTKEENADPPGSPEVNDSINEDTNQTNVFTNQYQDKPFETHMRPDINLEDATDERSNFQSVMITPNNGLRQKHQNLVPSTIDPTGRHHRNSGLLQMIHTMPRNPSPDNEPHDTTDEKLVEKILDMTLEDSKLQTPMIGQMHPPNCINPGMPNQLPNPNVQLQMGSNQVLPNHGLAMKTTPTLQMSGFPPQMQPIQNVGLPNPMNPPIQNVGMHNSALNSSLGLPIGPANNGLVMPIQGVPPTVIPNAGMQPRLGFQPGGGIPMMPGANVGNASLFMPPNNPPPMPTNEIPMPPNPNTQNNMFPVHPLQRSGSQGPFGSMFSQPPPPITPDSNLVDAWYYEDPEKIIQGPFSSKEMYNWYRAGFFSASLMVRRACEPHLRPLGSYGPVVPFIQLDMRPPFPPTAPVDRRRPRGMGVDDSLWSQSAQTTDMIWMQQMNPRNESRINNLPMYFWEPQGGSAISSKSLLPEEIAKEMKTEDQILAQLRASQNLPTPPNTSFMNEPSPPTSSVATSISAGLNKPDESFPTNVSATPNLEELQKLIQPENLTLPVTFPVSEPEPIKTEENEEIEVKEKPPKVESPADEHVPRPESPAPLVVPKQQETQAKAFDSKLTKQIKGESEKSGKKESNTAKSKSKKTKEEKKEEVPETKIKEEDNVPFKPEKRSIESSPTKGKKEEKQSKKEQDKEKKELIKDGFTIVKGAEKSSNKENKKKAEEAKALAAATEEADRKKKEEEKIAVEEEKKRKVAEAIKKAQEQQQQRQECILKKAPWSSVTAQAVATTKEGLTLAEIQRLEREKKVEQIKEQQQMMQIIAQQQAAAFAREQEMQAGLGWAKKKASNVNVSGQSLAEIQAETRKAAAAAAAAAATAAAAAAQALDDSPPTTAVHAPWASTHNGGFWETQANLPSKVEKAADNVKSTDNTKVKKKVLINISKTETTPSVEFETWCTSILSSWSSKIDVPTFIGFLKDIESPYEVKDYVKCYLGETKDSSDFARQFLERRSKLLRVGMVTPSDDLCSPAIAINPRNTSLGDYQEVKAKGKKAKKNKMLKVDARILGFSVTAAEDRINVGDIDTV